MVFPEIPLDEIATLKRGYDLPATRRRPGRVPIVSSKGVIGHHSSSRVEGPGVVLGRTGTLGRVLYVAEDFWPLNTTLYVSDFKGNDPRFVSCLLETVDYGALNDKAAIPGVSRHALHRLRLPLPPLPKQREIAGRLGLLGRKIALLERMERVASEWTAALFRQLPRARTVRVAEICDRIVNGGTPQRRNPAYWSDGTIPWFRSGELRDAPLVSSGERITPEGVKNSACHVLEAGTVLLALYAAPTVGRLGVLTERAAANQACCALSAPAPSGPWVLLHALLESRERLRRLAVGAAQQNLQQKTVRNLELRLPDPAVAQRFHEQVAPIHAQRAVHIAETRTLADWRTTLLRRELKTPSSSAQP